VSLRRESIITQCSINPISCVGDMLGLDSFTTTQNSSDFDNPQNPKYYERQLKKKWDDVRQVWDKGFPNAKMPIFPTWKVNGLSPNYNFCINICMNPFGYNLTWSKTCH
jgi:hypothetical protein